MTALTPIRGVHFHGQFNALGMYNPIYHRSLPGGCRARSGLVSIPFPRKYEADDVWIARIVSLKNLSRWFFSWQMLP
jgi:hypothetical protein